MENTATAVRASIDLALEPSAAFEVIVEELAVALERLEIRLDIGRERVTAGEVEVARIISWAPGERIVFEWHPSDWKPDEVTEVELRFEPVYHRPNFRAILETLGLTADDYLLEVGCGGGAFLQEALRSGCRAAAVDHSADMVRLAREVNHDAIAEHRLEILEASADRLPFPDATFSCAVMTGVPEEHLPLFAGRGGQLLIAYSVSPRA
jgi:hypothetical protein